MPSISGTMDPKDKQLVATLTLGNVGMRVNGIDAGNNPEYLKNYDNLLNKPSINGVELRGDIDSDNLNIMRPLTDSEIDDIMVVPEEV